MLDTVVNLSTA